ncbi:TetR/AcrR family transcriptional regulator [Pseudomonas indica]|uniref:TetR/AcrR family transcriptional regulator n=1 Tax=Pseudomonas indica TaxID=137658 RepID=UPI003FD3F29B
MKKAPTADQILDTALDLADFTGWERLHLYVVAARLDVGLDAIAKHFRQKDDLVEAWFDRADQAMLRRAKATDLLVLSPAKRLEELLVAWLASLSTHRAVTRQMLLYKLEPGHIHLQLGGLLRVSRTVQWWREAAQRHTTHLTRIAEETALTAAYLCTFVHWLRHPDEDEADLRAHLRRQLRSGPLTLLLREESAA